MHVNADLLSPQANNCKREDGTMGPGSIPGYVSVYQQSSAVPYDKTAANATIVGNIVVHTTFASPNTNGTGLAGSESPKVKDDGAHDKEQAELQTLEALVSTATNFSLQASQYERTLLYIVPADATEQQQLGEIIQGAENSADNADNADSNVNSVTVNLVVPLLNTTSTAQNWCATFATAPPAPLHLEPCSYAPGYAGETSSQRFQYSPLSGSLLPLFIQEHAGAVAAGSWGNVTNHKNHTETGRQQNQVSTEQHSIAKSSTDIVAYTTSSQGSNFAVSHKNYLDLTFVPAASHPPLPRPGCAAASSAAPAPVPTKSSSSVPQKPTSARKSGERGPTTSPALSSVSTTYHWHHKSSSTIGSLKPSRHSHYSAPAVTATKTVTVTDGRTITYTTTSSSPGTVIPSNRPAPSSSHSSHKHKSSSVEHSSSQTSEGWESASSWIPVPTSSGERVPASNSAHSPAESQKHKPSSVSSSWKPSSVKASSAKPSSVKPSSVESSLVKPSSVVLSSVPPTSSSVGPSSAPSSVATQWSNPAPGPAASSAEPSSLPESGTPLATSSTPSASSTSSSAADGAGTTGTLWAVSA